MLCIYMYTTSGYFPLFLVKIPEKEKITGPVDHCFTCLGRAYVQGQIIASRQLMVLLPGGRNPLPASHVAGL